MPVMRATAPLLLASVSGRQLETISRLRSRVVESFLAESGKSPEIEVEIGQSEDSDRKCITMLEPVCCASNAGDPENRLNDRDQPYEDEFWISHEDDYKTVCAETYVDGATWGMLLNLGCKKGNVCADTTCGAGESCDCTDGQCKKGHDKEHHVTRDMIANDAISKDDELEFEKYKEENKPAKHWKKSEKFYHDEVDEHNIFERSETMSETDLGTVDVLVGKSKSHHQSCVTPTVPVSCTDDAASADNRLDDAGDESAKTFKVSVTNAGRQVCVEAQDEDGWDKAMQIRCSVLNPCALSSCSDGEHCDRRDGSCKSFPDEIIPKRIIFTGAVIPEQVVDRNRHWVETGTEFRYYDDAQMEQSVGDISKELEKVGVPGASDAWHKLRPMAFRADLWRYMILWSEGGVYLDHKLMLNAPLASLVNRSRGHVHTVVDTAATEDDGTMDIYWNAVISAKKGDEGLLQAIRESIESIEKASYDFGEHFNVLYFTGPGRLGRSLKHSGVDVSVIGHFEKYDPEDEASPAAVLDENKQPVIIPDEEAHDSAFGSAYARLFNAHAVFCDEPMPEHLAAMHDPCADEVANLQIVGNPYWSLVVSP